MTTETRSWLDRYESAPDGAGLRDKGGVYDLWRNALAAQAAALPRADRWQEPEVEHESWSSYVTWIAVDEDGDEVATVKFRLSNHDGSHLSRGRVDVECQLGRRDDGSVDCEGVEAMARLVELLK